MEVVHRRGGEATLDLPLTGWPNQALTALNAVVQSYADDDKVREFYIGRTNDAGAAGRRHRAQVVVTIYQTDSADNAIAVEDTLIRLWHAHPKCSNDAAHGGGGVSDQYVQYVYVALWFG